MKYNGLIQQIDSDINTNGQNQITGAKLNSALNAMIATLGDGFRIAGTVTPSGTAPTDPDNGMCYIPITAGTYTNFGGVTRNDDELALIYYNGSAWAKMSVECRSFGYVEIRNDVGSFSGWEMDELRKDFAVIFDVRNGKKELYLKAKHSKDGDGNDVMDFRTVPSITVSYVNDYFNVGYKRLYIEWSDYIQSYQFIIDDETYFKDVYTASVLEEFLSGKQDKLTFDTIPTTGSTNPITSGGVKNAISGFIDNTVSNLVNYYTKSETYSKTEVTDIIAAIHAARFEVVQSLPVRGETNVIYLLPASSPTTGNVYNEYVYVNNGWELIGSTSLDLSNYYTKTQTDNLLLGKQNTLTFDNAPTSGSRNPVTSNGIKEAIDRVSMPRGGTTGQVLAKASGASFDTEWVDQSGGGGGVTDVTVGGTSVVSGGVAVVPAIPDITDCIQKSQTAGLVKNDGTIDTTQYGTYSKPSGGIPSTDLSSAVQTSLGKADTALQSYTETDPVFSASAAAGITSSDISDWDGKAEPTPVVDASSQAQSTMEPNTVYRYGTLSGDTTFPAFATPASASVANVWCWTFTTPSTAPTITWPAGITAWAGGSAPTINASKSYEVSVMDGLALIVES